MEAISYEKPKAHESANIEGGCGKSVCILLWSTMNMQIENKKQYIYMNKHKGKKTQPAKTKPILIKHLVIINLDLQLHGTENPRDVPRDWCTSRKA